MCYLHYMGNSREQAMEGKSDHSDVLPAVCIMYVCMYVCSYIRIKTHDSESQGQEAGRM